MRNTIKVIAPDGASIEYKTFTEASQVTGVTTPVIKRAAKQGTFSRNGYRFEIITHESDPNRRSVTSVLLSGAHHVKIKRLAKEEGVTVRECASRIVTAFLDQRMCEDA